MTSTNVIKKLAVCALLIVPFASTAQPAAEDTTFLECNVSGVWRGPSGDEVLRPAVVSVEIYHPTNYLYISVTGPDDYITSAVSRERPGLISISNLSNDSQYYLLNVYQGVGGIKESNTSITINRVTGLLTVNNIFLRHNGRDSRTNYSGSCKKVNNQKRF